MGDSSLTWRGAITLFIAFNAFVMIIFNGIVFVNKKVYRTYSTTSILVSSSLLLAARVSSLLFFYTKEIKTDDEHLTD